MGTSAGTNGGKRGCEHGQVDAGKDQSAAGAGPVGGEQLGTRYVRRAAIATAELSGQGLAAHKPPRRSYAPAPLPARTAPPATSPTSLSEQSDLQQMARRRHRKCQRRGAAAARGGVGTVEDLRVAAMTTSHCGPPGSRMKGPKWSQMFFGTVMKTCPRLQYREMKNARNSRDVGASKGGVSEWRSVA